MLAFRRARVPVDGDASGRQMHSAAFMMQWHFYCSLFAAVFSDGFNETNLEQILPGSA